MTRIRWTIPAAEQLENIVRYIQQDNSNAAQEQGQRILDSIKMLESFPSIGRPGERKGTREVVCAPYVIVYRLKDDAAEILFIWRGSQDWR